jgi:radical SAM superfamily enzyme YgiQ (UPF0313 family)
MASCRAKVLFLEIDTERTWALASVGPAFIGSFIRKHGHEAKLLRIAPDRESHGIRADIEKEVPDLLAFSLTTRQWPRARDVARDIRRTLDIPVIAGGLHPTFAPESVFAAEGFDCVCLGEGEHAMLDLLSAMGKGDRIGALRIPNLWVKGGSRPELRSPIDPLDGIPFMARDLLDERHGVIHMCTQRGCPFSCTYCSARAFQDLYGGSYDGRRRSHGSVVEELLEIRRSGPLNYVIFLDDTFILRKDWVRRFCRIYGREIGTGFSIHARVETMDTDILAHLAEAGCRHIVYGVESGSFRVRRDIMERPVENARIIDVFRRTKDAGILVTANYMLGLPGETAEEIEQTLELNETLVPDDFGYFVYHPYHGTRLFDVCRDKGYIPEDVLDLPADNRHSILTLPDLGRSDIDRYYEKFAVARERLYGKRRVDHA